MHCPNCGTQFSTEQKFCRTCGLGLQAVAQLTAVLLDENASASSEQPDSSQAISFDHKDPARWSSWLVFLGVFVFLCGLMLIALNHILELDRVLDVPSIFAVLVGTLIMFYGVLFPRLHGPKPMRPMTTDKDIPSTTITTDLGFLPEKRSERSIVEHTTRHLEPILIDRDNPTADRN